jgi:hypothetical protein
LYVCLLLILSNKLDLNQETRFTIICVCIAKAALMLKIFTVFCNNGNIFFQHLLNKNFCYKKWGLSLTEQPFPTDKNRTKVFLEEKSERKFFLSEFLHCWTFPSPYLETIFTILTIIDIREYIDCPLARPACLPCFGWVVMSPATT